MEIYAICNPTAGSGRGKKIGARVEIFLMEKGISCRLHMTEYRGHAVTLAQAAREARVDMVLAIGGDGTALEVARGLMGSATALGIIPAGTGNDFIKTLGVPQEPLAALDYILTHPPQKTDAGEINGRLFLNEVGTGFDVMVLEYAAKAKRYCRGLLPYLYGVLKTLFRFKPIRLTYALEDGREEQKDIFVLAAGNGGVIGGGIRIAPQARADDGLLDVVIVENIPRKRLIARLMGLMQGKILDFPETCYRRVRALSFSAPGMRVNVDGEIIPEARAEIRLLPEALWICR